MADETTDVLTVEQLSFCVHFVSVCNNAVEVCEEFLGFCALPTTDAESITTSIVQFIRDSGLDTTKLVGKGFDGAANMSCHISGVSVRLKQVFLSAKYLTHCQNHALNLAIVASCTSVPDIRNFMNTLKELTLFLNTLLNVCTFLETNSRMKKNNRIYLLI